MPYETHLDTWTHGLHVLEQADTGSLGVTISCVSCELAVLSLAPPYQPPAQWGMVHSVTYVPSASP